MGRLLVAGLMTLTLAACDKPAAGPAAPTSAPSGKPPAVAISQPRYNIPGVRNDNPYAADGRSLIDAYPDPTGDEWRGWGKFRPGSERTDKITLDVTEDGKQTVDIENRRTVLIKASPEKVEFRTYDPTSEPKTPNLLRQTTLEASWRKPFAGYIPPERPFPTEQMTAGGKTYDCQVVVRNFKTDARRGYQKIWWSEKVPGGVVREEQSYTTSVKGAVVRTYKRVLELESFAEGPEGWTNPYPF